MIVTPDARTRRARTTTGTLDGAAPRAAELAHVDLDALRAYRQELIAEEVRVSYWRRIVQARLDMVVRGEDRPTLARLGDVLTEQAASSRRLSLLPIAAPEGDPPVPDLAVLWQTLQTSTDDQRVAGRLAAAEGELSAYRTGLHRRLDTATRELIARYREQPALALTALPRPPAGSAA